MAKGCSMLSIGEILEEAGRSKQGEVVFVVKRPLDARVHHSLKASPYRYVVDIEMEDGTILPEGYVLPH